MSSLVSSFSVQSCNEMTPSSEKIAKLPQADREYCSEKHREYTRPEFFTTDSHESAHENAHRRVHEDRNMSFCLGQFGAS